MLDLKPLGLGGVTLITSRVFRDARGRFVETWRSSTYSEAGLGPFVQDNVSMSARGVVRGLHFQNPNEQGKLVTVLHGRVFDVAVDIRPDSPTFRRWIGIDLSAETGEQLYIPPGFAHGFMALTDGVVFAYKCTAYYEPSSEHTLRWNDPAFGIEWPAADYIIGLRDAQAPTLDEFNPDQLPREARSGTGLSADAR